MFETAPLIKVLKVIKLFKIFRVLGLFILLVCLVISMAAKSEKLYSPGSMKQTFNTRERVPIVLSEPKIVSEINEFMRIWNKHKSNGLFQHVREKLLLELKTEIELNTPGCPTCQECPKTVPTSRSNTETERLVHKEKCHFFQ